MDQHVYPHNYVSSDAAGEFVKYKREGNVLLFGDFFKWQIALMLPTD